MRPYSPAELALLSQRVVQLVVLVDLVLSIPLRYCTAGRNVDVEGVTYLGAGQFGRIGALADSGNGDARPLEFELSGVTTASVAWALAEPVMGKPITISTVLLTNEGVALAKRLRWAGKGDLVLHREQGGKSAIGITAEHCAADLMRGVPCAWTDATQRALHAGDPSLQYMSRQVDRKVVWPAKSWFEK